MKKIAFMNQKGGVGKTTLTRNVGECLAREGHRVLLVDLDHQSNLTSSLNIKYIIDAQDVNHDIMPIEYTVVDFCIGDMFDDNYFRAVEITPMLHLLPNEIGFANKEIALQSRFSREYILTNILKEAEEQYDYCLIDCPPSFGLVTANALVAADALLVPVEPSEFAFRGLSTMIKNIAYVKQQITPAFFKVVLNDYEANTIEAEYAKQRLAKMDNVAVLATMINHAQAIKQAERKHVSVFEMDNKRVIEQIKNLTHEIIQSL